MLGLRLFPGPNIEWRRLLGAALLSEPCLDLEPISGMGPPCQNRVCIWHPIAGAEYAVLVQPKWPHHSAHQVWCKIYFEFASLHGPRSISTERLEEDQLHASPIARSQQEEGSAPCIPFVVMRQLLTGSMLTNMVGVCGVVAG